MKAYFLIISFCISLSVSMEVNASENPLEYLILQNRAKVTKLPACLGGICIGKGYGVLSNIAGNFFNRKIEKCDFYNYAITIEKKGKQPLEKMKIYSPLKYTLIVHLPNSNIKKYGYKAYTVNRDLHYKFSPLKSKEEQFAFVENLVFHKYGPPLKERKLSNGLQVYYYQINASERSFDDTIIIERTKDRSRISVYERFGNQHDEFKSCMKRKKEKEKQQDLLPD